MRNSRPAAYMCRLPEGSVAVFVLLVVAAFSGGVALSSADPPSRSPMDFALIGDMPYDARQEKEFANVMRDVNSADLAFVVHDGDFWWDGIAWKETTEGYPPCSDETFAHRLELVKGSRHPYILTPGDNDWADCHRAKPNSYDPLERLAKFRKTFFSTGHSLGQEKIRLTRQSENSRYAAYRENVRWVYGDVLFVTLHMIGSNNNLGRTPEMDKEYEERNAANLAWMKEAFALAKKNGNRALMIIAQANPQFENTWPASLQGRYMLKGLGIKPPKERRQTGFDSLLTELEKETLAFGRPVAYVHGDTHTFRIDKPLVGSKSGRMIENFTRVETIGYPDTHWIRVTIDPSDPNVFRFRQEIVRENRVRQH